MRYWSALLVMAGVTYLIRMLPMVLVRREIKNKFVLSFLKYVPYAVLAVMTVPGIFYATSSVYSAAVGFAAALILALCRQNLMTVAVGSCAAVFVTEWLMTIL